MNRRLIQWIGVLSAFGILLGAFGLQFIGHLHPCSLCWVQRGAMLALGIGFLFSFKRIRLGFGLAFIFGLSGLVAALFQLKEVLGSPPAISGMCTLQTNGSFSCAVAGSSRFVHIPMVDWGLGFFSFWILLSIWGLWFTVFEK